MEQTNHYPLGSDQRMIAAQANIISQLNSKIKSFDNQKEQLIREIERYKPNALMYLQIIEFVNEYPILQSMWDELINTMRVCDPARFK